MELLLRLCTYRQTRRVFKCFCMMHTKIQWKISEAAWLHVVWLHVARLSFPINCLNSPLRRPLEDRRTSSPKHVYENNHWHLHRINRRKLFSGRKTRQHIFPNNNSELQRASSSPMNRKNEKILLLALLLPSDLRLKLFTLILMLERMLYQRLSTQLEAFHVLVSIGIKATNWISMGEFPQKFSTSNSITRFWSILHRLIKLYKRKLFSDSDNSISQSS